MKNCLRYTSAVTEVGFTSHWQSGHPMLAAASIVVLAFLLGACTPAPTSASTDTAGPALSDVGGDGKADSFGRVEKFYVSRPIDPTTFRPIPEQWNSIRFSNRTEYTNKPIQWFQSGTRVEAFRVEVNFYDPNTIYSDRRRHFVGRALPTVSGDHITLQLIELKFDSDGYYYEPSTCRITIETGTLEPLSPVSFSGDCSGVIPSSAGRTTFWQSRSGYDDNRFFQLPEFLRLEADGASGSLNTELFQTKDGCLLASSNGEPFHLHTSDSVFDNLEVLRTSPTTLTISEDSSGSLYYNACIGNYTRLW